MANSNRTIKNPNQTVKKPTQTFKNQSQKVKKIACIGGGSGWHILPIVILHEHLKQYPGVECFWIGEKWGMDEQKATEHGISFYGIPSIKLRRHFSFRTLLQPFLFIGALGNAWRVLRETKPDVIFCKGGGVALSVAVCAWIRKIPLYAHESDSIPGLTNRVVGFFAKKVFLGIGYAAKYFAKTPTQEVGQWMDPIFTDYIKEHSFQMKSKEPVRVVLQCGGLGSTTIFNELLRILPDFSDMEFTIGLGTKNEHFLEKFEKFPNAVAKKWIYHDELAQIYSNADIGIVRAGVTTLSECELFGVRMIMIPLPIASFDHQTKNAEIYVSKNPEHILLSEADIRRLGELLASMRNYKKTSYGINSNRALETISQALLDD